MASVIGGDLAAVSAGEATAPQSAVSWAAIFAGAATALGVTLVLLALGAGLGFAAASPWPGAGASTTTFAIGTGIWLIVMQWLSSAMGGYIAGRLRTRWTGLHTHEVFFRDTAHGLLAWAASSIIVAAVALGATASTLGVATTGAANAVSYATDTMLRTTGPADENSKAAVRTEIGRILSREGTVGADDKAYIAQVVAKQTGVSQPEAERRVNVAIDSVRDAADKARKAASALGFFTALSMLIGAFIAAVSAAYAGQLRDDAGTKLHR